MSGNGVNVTVETSTDNQIIEVGYDGQETVQPPLTLTENLAKQAAKINFHQVIEDGENGGTGDAVETEEPQSESSDEGESSEAAVWPWESTRNKLRDALTELSVLSDVITVATKEIGKDPAKSKRYMVLDGPVQADPPEPKPLVTYLAKKKSLEAPSRILLQGAEQLEKLLTQTSNPENSRSKAPMEDFHLELLKLRQNWRLKKVSHTILGDLSYRTAGSHFRGSGVFEVLKASNEDSDSQGTGPRSSLKVTVPSELRGVAFIQVIIQKEQESLASAQLVNPGQSGANLGGSGDKGKFWQTKLEAAQNVLFCKELFSQLAKEAIQLQAPIPHMVVGNQITASLFPDIQLLITLCHSTPGNETQGPEKPAASQREHLHVLEHSLYQLLRMQHQRNINPDHAGLSTAPVGISKRRRLAGPGAAARKDLLEMASSETLLEQIIKQAQHVVLRLRTAYVLDTMARDLKDPLISCHWGTISSPTRTSVKVKSLLCLLSDLLFNLIFFFFLVVLLFDKIFPFVFFLIRRQLNVQLFLSSGLHHDCRIRCNMENTIGHSRWRETADSDLQRRSGFAL